MTDSIPNTIKLIDIQFDYSKPSLSVESNWYIIIGIIVLLILLRFAYKKLLRNRFEITEMEVEISGSPKAKFVTRRDDSSIYIANRIYIELITRKAAMPFEEDKDVIVEVYDSWYKLFSLIRDEIKSVPGHYLKSHDSTNALIGLTIKILNNALRPHLTEYQAKFRKWYNLELKKHESENLSPQELQKKYPDYKNLVDDIKRVNLTLIDYSKALNKLIKGK